MILPYSFLCFFLLSAVVLSAARTHVRFCHGPYAWTQKRFIALRPRDVRLFIHSFIYPYTTLRSRAPHTWGSKFSVQALSLLGSEALSAARPGVRSLFVRCDLLPTCPRPCPRNLFPMFGTGVGCFVLEEALQHAGRKADGWGVIHAIQSFGAHINNACPGGKTTGRFLFSPHSPIPYLTKKKTF